jgi:thioredoxin reductase/NAD-dependent dihydropyrimidine dehydrogenase PreA subunit
MEYLAYAIYAGPLLLALVWYLRRRARSESLATHAVRANAGAEPASLHPLIDPVKCIGCGSCVKACPEQPQHTVLGLINGKAQLIGPSDCIGHGACRAACPVDAITLVLGTERRGVDIPLLSPEFQTNVPGIFVAGELGGMGLIRNALEQGRQAVEAIHRARRRGGERLDVVIVGAGPAGFAASLTAKSRNMRFVTLEQESLGGCVFQYPRGKLVMTQPAYVPIAGRIKFTHTSKEELLEFWRGIESKAGQQVRYRERVDAIDRDGADGFIVRTPLGEYRAHSVLLAIGRRGTPRKLEVPGEEQPKVVYRLIDPEQYAGQRVLVVGGGDSAIEAAIAICEVDGTAVTLSYRGAGFDRVKARNRERIESARRAGHVSVLLNSTVQRIDKASVALTCNDRPIEVENESVIINAGGTLPTDFLRRVGVAIETKYGTA